jgi:hypothetical protein
MKYRMPKYLTIWMLSAISLLSVSAKAQEPDSRRKALIIAIGEYPAAGGWPVIASTNDIGYVKKTLLNQGFPEKNLSILANQHASMEGIKAAFMDLIQHSSKGDIVVIHISSHGEQLEADNNNKMDGLDECVVTYNAIAPSRSGSYDKDQAQYLRGYIIGNFLQQLRIKLGPDGDLIVFMDNCHSGAGTRGEASIRGGVAPFVSPRFEKEKHRKSDSSMVFRAASGLASDQESISSYVVFSATRPEELDTETKDENTGQGVGSLTYAYSKAFEILRAEKAEPSYRALFSKIQAIMNLRVPDQHPLLEGNGIDRLVFGGRFFHQMPYVGISSLHNTNLEIVLNQGALSGLDSGATLAIYPAGTIDTLNKAATATAQVFNATAFTATAKLNRRLGSDNAAEWIAYIRNSIYDIEPVRIQLQSKPSVAGGSYFSSGELNFVKTYLKGKPFISFSSTPELLICKGGDMDSLKISSNGFLFSTVSKIAVDSLDLLSKLASYARFKFLQKMSSQVEDLNVDITLVPIINQLPDSNAIRGRMVNNTFTVYDQDSLAIWISNTGKKDAYVNILDLQPNGIINPILPNRKMQVYPHDLKISAGETYHFPVQKYFLQIGPPFGTEVFKIFISEQEIDLEQIATFGLVGKKGNPVSALEKLIARTYGLTRGLSGDVQVLNDDNNAIGATTKEIVFIIRPKK